MIIWEEVKVVRVNEPSEAVLDAFARACYDIAARAVARGYVPTPPGPQQQPEKKTGSRGV